MMNALLSATVDGGLPPPPTGYFAAVLTPEPSDQGWLVYVGYGKDLMGSLNPVKTIRRSMWSLVLPHLLNVELT